MAFKGLQGQKKKLKQYSTLYTEYLIERDSNPPSVLRPYLKKNKKYHTYLGQLKTGQFHTKRRNYHSLKGQISRLKKLIDHPKSSDFEVEKALQRIERFSQNKERLLPKTKAFANLAKLAKNLARNQKFEYSQKAYQLALRFSAAKNRSRILFGIIWNYIIQERFSEAHHIISQNNLLKKTDSLSLKQNFWIAYVCEQLRKLSLSKELYTSIISKNPLNYYSILAHRRMLALSKDKKLKKYFKTLLETRAPISLSTENFTQGFKKSLERLSIWAHVDLGPFLTYQVQSIFDKDPRFIYKKRPLKRELANEYLHEKMHLITSKVISQSKNYLKSFTILHKGLSQEAVSPNSQVIQTLFPRPYKKQINYLAKGIDPILLYPSSVRNRPLTQGQVFGRRHRPYAIDAGHGQDDQKTRFRLRAKKPLNKP